MKRKRLLPLALCAVLVALTTLLSGCGGPDSAFLKKTLSQDPSFFAMFDSHAGDDLEKYQLSEVKIKNSEKDSGGGVNLTADITCTSSQAQYTGEFDFMLDPQDGSWTILKKTLVQGAYHDVAAPTQAELLADWNNSSQAADLVGSGFTVSVDHIDQLQEGGVDATADLTLSLQTKVCTGEMSGTMTLSYTGVWETTDVTDLDENNFTAQLTLPMGTYLLKLGSDFEAVTLEQQAASDLTGLPDYWFTGYGYDSYYQTLDILESGEPYLDDGGEFLDLGGIRITMDDTGTPTLYQGNGVLSYVSDQPTMEEAISAVIGGYQVVGPAVPDSVICCFVAAQGLDPNKIANYPNDFKDRLRMKNILSGSIYDTSFLAAVQDGWAEEWMSLYVWNSSDPDYTATPAIGNIPPACWYDKSNGQWTWYGILYQDAANAGWGSTWKEILSNYGCRV